MSEYVFNYYKNFKCIDSECKHTCCAGWEIDIDKKTLKKYKKTKGNFSTRIKSGVNFKKSCFNMQEGKCPFLNNKNLCDLIITYGDGYLSNVCKEHPRFYNFFSGRREKGLGLTCEAACNLILSVNKIELECEESGKEKLTPWEREILSFRKNAVDVVYSGKDLKDVIKSLTEFIDYNPVLDGDFMGVLIKTERVDKSFNDLLKIEKTSFDTEKLFGKEYRNILSYFLYRHLPTAVDKFDLKVKTAFSVLSLFAIKNFADNYYNQKNKCDKSNVVEFARAYSTEIEYSPENLSCIFSYVERRINLKV